MVGALTGRLSSSDPNLQNIPIRTEEGRSIRTAFIAEPGSKIISADYSQIELRLVAHIAKEKTMLEAFRNNIDIHAQTAAEVFQIPIAQLDSETRRRAKAINFGIIYGISGFGLARQLGISQTVARDYIKAYFARFPGIRGYMEQMKQVARDNGFVETLFGRRIYISNIKSSNGAVRGFAERQAINAPIQGSAADIIKRAMIKMPDTISALNLNTKMLLQVHDELIFETAESEIDIALEAIKTTMETAHQPVLSLDVPIIVDGGAADSWAEAH
jgi:DNA polymerase-1